MSTKHLTLGSVDPPRKKDLLRIYSMKFCPFAARALTVLLVKNIPHEIVNINLEKKPEWYTEVVPTGKVPAIIDGSKMVVESIDICDYLDEKYPNPPLYPSDPEAKEKDKKLMEIAEGPIMLFAKCLYTPIKDDKLSLEDWTKSLLEALQPLEDELLRRGTKFFGGETPGMVDYFIYPFSERAECLPYRYGQKLPIKDTEIPLLRKWKKAMFKQPAIQQLYISGERFWKCFSPKWSNKPQIYDEA